MQTQSTITSREGDTLSAIAYRYYGSSSGQVERIMQTNPDLCRQPAILPAGIPITLPPAETDTQHTLLNTVNLWD